MKKLKDIVDLPNHRLTKGQYGIEIEIEGRKLPNRMPEKYWHVDVDGSLQGEAYEYVMVHPRSLTGVKSSLKILEEAYIYNDSVVKNSVRTGVHVHMNVQDWSVIELFTFIICYYLVEDLLIHWCGPNREGNLFCLRSKDAELVMFSLLDSVNRRDFSVLNNENIRYASLNFNSLFRYGSLEFRAMRSSEDNEVIYKWVCIINEMVKNFRKFGTPDTILSDISGDEPQNFINKLFPTYGELLSRCPDAYDKVWEAVRRVQMLAFTVDWDYLRNPSNNIFDSKSF